MLTTTHTQTVSSRVHENNLPTRMELPERTNINAGPTNSWLPSQYPQAAPDHRRGREQLLVPQALVFFFGWHILAPAELEAGTSAIGNAFFMITAVAISLMGMVAGRMSLRKQLASMKDTPSFDDKTLLELTEAMTRLGTRDFIFSIGPARADIFDGGK